MNHVYPTWSANQFTSTRWSVIIPTAYYVSKSGNDHANDGSPQRPFRTIGRAILGGAYFGIIYLSIVIGSGVYNEGITTRDSTPILYGDGLVNLSGQGLYALFSGPATANNISISDFVTLSSHIIPKLHNCQVRNVPQWGNLNTGSFGFISVTWSNCLFINCFATGGANWTEGTFTNLTFINSLFYANANANAYTGTVVSACFFDENSTIAEPNDLNVYRRYYNCSVLGSVGSANQSIAQATAQYPLVYRGCVALPANFNNPAAQDYTLAQDSPIRNLSAEGSYVGAYGVGLNFAGVNDAETLVNAVWNNALAQFVPANTALPMSVEFVTKDTGRTWILDGSYLVGIEDNADKQTIDSTLSYQNVNGVAVDTPSGSIAAGKGYWVQGYDTLIYDGLTYNTDTFLYGVAGVSGYQTTGAGKVVLLTEIPNIRLLEMKTSTTSQGDCDSSSYKLYAMNRKPTYNIAGGRSNGDPNFDLNNQEPLLARWIKVRVTILPNSIA